MHPPRQINQLGTLPTELVVAILRQLPDVQALRNARLSCRALNEAFLPEADSIWRQVCLFKFDFHLWRDAVIVHEVSQVARSSWTKELAIEKSDHYTITRTYKAPQPSDLEPKTLLGIANFFQTVEDMTSSFFEHCFHHLPQFSPESEQDRTDPPRPSMTELTRVRRLFYRYELCCFLLTPLGRDRESFEPFESLYPRFATWENEQLACIYDFLFTEYAFPGK